MDTYLLEGAAVSLMTMIYLKSQEKVLYHFLPISVVVVFIIGKTLTLLVLANN